MSTATPRLPVRLYNAAARLGERVGRRSPRFAAGEDRFLESARRATGIEDFGDEAFLVHLRVLLPRRTQCRIGARAHLKRYPPLRGGRR